MISLEDSKSCSGGTHRCPLTRPYYYYTPPPSSAAATRSFGRSMRRIRSNMYRSGPAPESSPNVSEDLTDSVIDLELGELAVKPSGGSKNSPLSDISDILDISRSFSDLSACSSDISGELRHLAALPDTDTNQRRSLGTESETEPEPCSGFLERETFSTEIIESISPEDLQPTVKLCVDALRSTSTALKRSAAAKLRLLAKNRADNRVLIGESGSIPALIPLLRCPDPDTQEHAVTALLNLSLHDGNKTLIAAGGGAKALIYALRTGTEASKQNAACALLSLAATDEARLSIGACGAIPPLVALLAGGSSRGKKDALAALYKLCTAAPNKERAVAAGAVGPLVALVAADGRKEGLAEKAAVVLGSLAGVEAGREAVVRENGIAALVEALEDGEDRVKEFAVSTLLQVCGESVLNRGLVVAEGGVPPLVALSLTGTARAKHKAETLLRYLREARQETSSSACSSSTSP
ncbi:U-box domain-containing protein [Striga asiatica]|uniref:U-box domain-containing protein n=1 Tax=Striga asiatica TaxID=4170 RepID=A0A5A7RGH2_STRAF|nr:U-box domain-containing protein [Striga asiatica]